MEDQMNHVGMQIKFISEIVEKIEIALVKEYAILGSIAMDVVSFPNSIKLSLLLSNTKDNIFKAYQSEMARGAIKSYIYKSFMIGFYMRIWLEKYLENSYLEYLDTKNIVSRKDELQANIYDKIDEYYITNAVDYFTNINEKEKIEKIEEKINVNKKKLISYINACRIDYNKKNSLLGSSIHEKNSKYSIISTNMIEACCHEIKMGMPKAFPNRTE